MSNALKSNLFWRISAVFLIILILLGLAYVTITARSARSYFQETTQRLNAKVAEQMLLEVNPFVDGKVNAEAVGKIMHSMMAVNPSLEVYLLNPNGDILKYVVLDKEVRLKNVSLEPVQEFLEKEGDGFMLGDDPRKPGGETIFSTAEVRENGELLGYVYMVLASEEYENVAGALQGSYFLKVGAQTFAITLVGAFLIGLLLIALLTQNLRKIVSTVKRFESGDYKARIPVKGKGELAQLSRTFNTMADTILENIEELKEVDRLRRELIANVSHDLRSPLAVIHGYIETMMLKEGKLTEAERKNYLGRVLKNSDRLQKLVADLFELSKLEARQVEVRREKFDVSELLQDTALQYQILAKEKGLKIETNLDKNARAEADIALIQRVMQNLLDNALKFSEANSSIKMESETKGGRLHISIKNSGQQIAQNDLPHLFDRYYKKSETGGDSTGLGLAIAKKIMDLHDGEIKAESTPDGETIFTVILAAA